MHFNSPVRAVVSDQDRTAILSHGQNRENDLDDVWRRRFRIASSHAVGRCRCWRWSGGGGVTVNIGDSERGECGCGYQFTTKVLEHRGISFAAQMCAARRLGSMIRDSDLFAGALA